MEGREAAGIPTMTATILARAPEAGERLALQCIENLLRSDLRPVEEAKAYRQLMSLNGWTAAQLSRELAVSESKVTRAMALLELPEPVQTQVESGILPPATAYEISKVEDRERTGRARRAGRPREALAPGHGPGRPRAEAGSQPGARRPRSEPRTGRVRDPARQGNRARRPGLRGLGPGGGTRPGPPLEPECRGRIARAGTSSDP